MLRSKFAIERATDKYLYIIDTGVLHKSVTNDAGAVLSYLYENNELGNRRLFYRDSHGQIDEIVHDSGTFKGFARGHADIDDLP